MGKIAQLIDVTKCTACRGCQVACKQWNQLGARVEPNYGTYQSHKDLNPQTYTIVKFFEKEENGQVKWLFRKHGCMHCTEAACVKVCPKKALQHLENGIVSRDREKCIGCGYCANNCAFGITKVDKAAEKATKCTLCEDRVAEGLTPACTKACLSGAIQFGDREKMLELGQARVNQLKSNGISAANLYGDKIVGGTHVLYVLGDTPSAYGLPTNPTVPLSITLWQDVVKPIGALAVGGALAASLVSFFMSSGKSQGTSESAGKGGETHGQ